MPIEDTHLAPGSTKGSSSSLPTPKSPLGRRPQRASLEPSQQPEPPAPMPQPVAAVAPEQTPPPPQAVEPVPAPAPAPVPQPQGQTIASVPPAVPPQQITAPPQPAQAPIATQTLHIDPNAFYEVNGLMVRGASLTWSNGLRAQADRDKTEARLVREDVGKIAEEAAQRAVAAVMPTLSPQQQPPQSPAVLQPFNEPEPMPPAGVYEDSPEYKQYVEKRADWRQQKIAYDAAQRAAAPFLEMQQKQLQQTEQAQAQQRLVAHNAQMIENRSVQILQERLGINYMALSQQDRQDVLYRLQQAGAEEGIPFSRDGIRAHREMITEDKLKAVVYSAFSDGYRPGAEQPQRMMAPAPAQLTEVELMAQRVAMGLPVEDRAPNPQPLLPPTAAPPGTPVTGGSARPMNRPRRFEDKAKRFLGATRS